MMYRAMPVFGLLGRLLPERLLQALTVLVGSLVYLALPGKRASMRRNVATVLGEQAGRESRLIYQRIDSLARRSMIAYCQTLLDFMRLPHLLPQVFADTEQVPGWEYLDAALAAGRGVVVVTAHFGHWDLAGAAVARHCPPGRLFAVAEEFEHEGLNQHVLRQRAAYGIGVVPMDNVRRMVRVLRDGNALLIVADRPVGENDGVPVEFFGRRTQVPAGTAVLAGMAKCPIMIGYLRRRRDGRFIGEILPPIEPAQTGNREADLAATMQQVMTGLEQIIRRSPHQWYMFRDMWPVPDRGPAWARPARSRLRFGAMLVTGAWLGLRAVRRSGSGAGRPGLGLAVAAAVVLVELR